MKTKKEENELHKWIESIPSRDVRTIKQLIIERCKSQDHIFRNWKSGITKVPLLERTIINKLSQEYDGTAVFKLDDDVNTTKTSKWGIDVR
jgi:hypothetical protein